MTEPGNPNISNPNGDFHPPSQTTHLTSSGCRMASLRWATSLARQSGAMHFDGLFGRSNGLRTHRLASTCITTTPTKSTMVAWHRPSLFETTGMLGRMQGGVRGFANHRVRKLILLFVKGRALFAAIGYSKCILLFRWPLSLLQHKRLLKHAKGYRGRSKNCFTIAIRRVEKAWQYAYRDRKVKKRVWRTLWIQRLSAAARQYNIRYSRLIAGLNYASVPLNRKVLSELAATEPFAFKSVIDVIKYQQAEHDAKKLL
jgi:large subunit ribosomal protein L20